MTTDGHRWFAACYALQSRFTERGRMLEARRRLLAGLAGDVLEVGAGTGANFAHYPPEARVVAIEPDPHMLRRAQAALAELGARNIDVRLAAAEHLPFADASFDAGVITLVLCSVGDVAQALAELRRVLRPGAEVRFMEHVRGRGLLGRSQNIVQPVWGWCAAGCHLNRDIESALRSAGFDMTSVHRTKMAPWMPMIRGVATAPGVLRSPT